MLVRGSGHPPVVAHDTTLTVRRAGPGDGVAYARWIGTESPSSFGGRLSSTTHCFLVEAGTDLLHASWVTTSAAWTRELRRYIVPPPGDAYVYESYTHPAARGRGVYPFALAEVCCWAQRSAIGRVWVAVERDNLASQKAIRKAGFGEVFRVGYRRLLGRVSVSDPVPAVADAPQLVTRSRKS